MTRMTPISGFPVVKENTSCECRKTSHDMSCVIGDIGDVLRPHALRDRAGMVFSMGSLENLRSEREVARFVVAGSCTASHPYVPVRRRWPPAPYTPRTGRLAVPASEAEGASWAWHPRRRCYPPACILIWPHVDGATPTCSQATFWTRLQPFCQ